MSAVGPESADGAASRVPPLLPLPPSPPPLCRAPTLSRLSPGAGARGRAGGGARRWAGARAPNTPPPLSCGGGMRGNALRQALRARLRTAQGPWLRPLEPEHSDWSARKCCPTLALTGSAGAQMKLFVCRLRCSFPTLVCVGVRKAEAKGTSNLMGQVVLP